MLQKDDFFCHRTLLFSSSARNPLHGKNEAIWCCYLVFFTIISSASDYLSLVKKTNLIWEPESDASGKKCCASDEAKNSKCLRNKSRNSILISRDYPATHICRCTASERPLVFLCKITPCVVIRNLAGWDNNWIGFKGQFFSDLIPDRSPFVINIETAFQSHAVKFFDNTAIKFTVISYTPFGRGRNQSATQFRNLNWFLAWKWGCLLVWQEVLLASFINRIESTV